MEIGRRQAVTDVTEQRAESPPADIWQELERTPEFRQLVAAKMRFVVPATIFFLAYYFLLPLLNGLAPNFMRTYVIGHVNIAYLFALSEFVVAWILAYLYIRQANTVFDPLAEAVRRRLRGAEDVTP